MANYSVVKAVHKTFTGTTADTVAFTQSWSRVEIVNRDPANNIFYTINGATPTASADDTAVVVSSSAVVEAGLFGPSTFGGASIKLVGSGGAYSVVGLT